MPGHAEQVIRRFADVPRMARCVPGAVLEPQAEDGAWPGAMVVAFGPKKISFKGRVTTSFDFDAKTGALHGRGAADMRAARIGVKVGFALHDDPAAATPTTVVRVTSDAELGGVLADFARTGGIAVANVLMQDFARRATEEFSREDTPPEPSPVAAATVPSAATVPATAAPASTPDAAAEVAVAAEAGQAAPASTPELASDSAAPVTAPASAEAAATRTPPAATVTRAPPPPAPAALSAHGLLWAVLRHKLLQFARWLGLRTGGSP